MADYIEPTKTAFNDAEQVAIDVLTQADSNLITKIGSVIRELLIRPVAYLLSWITGNIQNDIKQYSVAYLKTSQLTVNPVADAVASNYFVTRREGTASRGVITMTLNSPTLSLSAGARFTVGGVAMCTPVQYFITSDTAGRVNTDTLVYIKSVAYGSYWLANIPVVAVSPGRVELPVGSDVAVGFSCSALVDAELTSPVTGGSDTETDAQLMQRAEYNTAEAGIGTYYGIKKKLTKSPVNVIGMSVIAGEDQPIFRGRFNSVNINPGGYVDCHIKTNNQAVTGTIDMEVTNGSLTDPNFKVGARYALTDETYTVVCKLDGTQCPGFIRVSAIVAGGREVNNFSVAYGTSDPNMNAEGARLSDKQTATVTFTGEGFDFTNEPTVRIAVAYMPAIDQVQDFLDSDIEHFIGQDIMVKTAVPVNVRVDCDVQSVNALTEDDLNGIRQTIADYINSLNVGVGVLNFSDIRAAVLTAFPQVNLRLPCVLAGETYTKSGYIDTFFSNAGVLDITKKVTNNYWGYQVCFFNCTNDNVRLNVI